MKNLLSQVEAGASALEALQDTSTANSFPLKASVLQSNPIQTSSDQQMRNIKSQNKLVCLPSITPCGTHRQKSVGRNMEAYAVSSRNQMKIETGALGSSDMKSANIEGRRRFDSMQDPLITKVNRIPMKGD